MGVQFQLAERFICSEGYVSDNHLWFWNAVLLFYVLQACCL